MKWILGFGVFMVGFYAMALHVIAGELRGLADVYSNLDQISAQVAAGQSPSLNIQPDKAKAVIDAYTSAF